VNPSASALLSRRYDIFASGNPLADLQVNDVLPLRFQRPSLRQHFKLPTRP